MRVSRARSYFVSVSCLLFASCLYGEEPTPMAGKQVAVRLAKEVRVRRDAEYLLYLPKGYDAANGKKWPLILFLHGAGERGSNLELVKKHGPPKLVDAGRELPFIIVSPQCPEGRIWSSASVFLILDEVLEKHAVDTERVYLTGLSMGGFGTWSLAAEAPERFAAIAPICGGGSMIHGFTLAKVPVWAFHGGKDPVVPVDESRRMVEMLKRRGNSEARLTVLPEAGHDSWTEPYAGEDLYEWFLGHRGAR